VSISTHVLDLAHGRPRAGLRVRLERGTGDGWVELARGLTDSEGRLRDWTPERLDPGRYRLVFATGGEFFPEVPVVFQLTDATGNLHIPLLLNEFGYTTYRGS
jgi:5-hydroxyisourate hydrolase